MSCERFGPAIAAHAAGATLNPAAGRHLGGCATCRQLLDTQARLLAELDAELGRSLSITASPDFTARVARGARDAAAAPAHRWVPAPVWAGLGLAAAIMLAVWIGADVRLRPEATQTNRIGVQRTTEAGQTSAADVRLKAGAARGAPETIRRHPGSAGTASRNARLKLPSSEPRVIVEPSRALAIQRLRELITEGSLDGQMLPPPVTPEAALAELTIAPLAVTEIRVPDVQTVSRPPAAPERQ